MKIGHAIILAILALIFIPLVGATCNLLSVESLQPALTITKSTTVPNYGAPGVIVTYNYTVNNTGNTNVTDINVTDITLGQKIALYNTTTNSLVTPATILNQGENVTGNATYITSQADVNNGSVINIANVNGTAIDPRTCEPIGSVSNTTTYTLYAQQSPALQITKLAKTNNPDVCSYLTGQTYDAVGQIITYYTM
jgi:hypothetical protein